MHISQNSKLIKFLSTTETLWCKYRSVLSLNRSSMTTDRSVDLGRIAMHPKRLASISEINVLNAFVSSGPRKLNYC